jgi:hypothetical protein
VNTCCRTAEHLSPICSAFSSTARISPIIRVGEVPGSKSGRPDFYLQIGTARGDPLAVPLLRRAPPRALSQHRARGLEILTQRHRQTAIAYLDRSEMEALLAAPDRSTWLGRRDHAMLLVGIQTGVRVSELANLTIDAVSLDTGGHLRVTGKGDKERCAILTSETIAVLREWLRERDGHPQEPLFPTRRGQPLTTRAFELRLDKHTATAAAAAEASGIPVLHYDEDYDRIAGITGQEVRWRGNDPVGLAEPLDEAGDDDDPAAVTFEEPRRPGDPFGREEDVAAGALDDRPAAEVARGAPSQLAATDGRPRSDRWL